MRAGHGSSSMGGRKRMEGVSNESLLSALQIITDLLASRTKREDQVLKDAALVLKWELEDRGMRVYLDKPDRGARLKMSRRVKDEPRGIGDLGLS